MVQAATSPRIYRFGEFELFADTAELRKNGSRVKLQGQPFQILVMLVEARGEVVTRDALRCALWPADTFVDFEHSLNTAVKKLRQALGESAEEPRFIETLPRVGYRMLLHAPALVVPIAPPSTSVAPAPEGTNPSRRSMRLALLVGTSAVLLALAAFALYGWLRSPFLRITSTRQVVFTGDCLGSTQTDGHRIYFYRVDHSLHSYALDGSGEVSFPTRFSEPVMLDISPDGSNLLVKEFYGQTGPTTRIWLQPTNGAAPRPLGDVQGDSAAFLPHSNSIAFVLHKTIYITADEGATSRPLLEAPGQITSLHWSPDGTRVRFTIVDMKTSKGSLWEANADGHGLHRLQFGLDAGENLCCGMWTHDGQHFLFLDARNMRSDLWTSDEHWSPFRSGKPALLSAGGPEVVYAVSSPSENRLLIVGSQSTTASFHLDPVRHVLTPLFPARSIEDPSYSPDGKSVTYAEQHTEENVLWRANSDGSAAAQLTDAKLLVRWPHFSPDGKRIAFMGKWPDKTFQIFWISADGGAPHEIQVPVVSQADVNWMPDNHTILFGQTPWYLADPDTPLEIFLHNLETGSLEKIPGSLGWFSPRLSPDARSFVALSADAHKLALYDFQSKSWRLLLNSEGLIGAPFWAPDGKSIYLNQHPENEGIDVNSHLINVRLSDLTVQKVVAFNELLDDHICNAWTTAPDGSILVSCGRITSNLFELTYE